MIFDEAKSESRQRFAETLAVLNFVTSIAQPGAIAASDVDRAIRGLWLVSLYGAFERSINATVEAAIYEISSHNTPSMECLSPIHSIFHFSRVKSVKDCGYKNVFDKSSEMFNAAFGGQPLELTENPLADMLQNVDSDTIQQINKYFGASSYLIDKQNSGRLNILKERRNAISHGRELASSIGGRYSHSELRKIYEIADFESTRFFLHLQEFCESKKYIKTVA